MFGTGGGTLEFALCSGHGELVCSPQSNLQSVNTWCMLGVGSGSVAAELIHLSPFVDASSSMVDSQLSLNARGACAAALRSCLSIIYLGGAMGYTGISPTCSAAINVVLVSPGSVLE